MNKMISLIIIGILITNICTIFTKNVKASDLNGTIESLKTRIYSKARYSAIKIESSRYTRVNIEYSNGLNTIYSANHNVINYSDCEYFFDEFNTDEINNSWREVGTGIAGLDDDSNFISISYGYPIENPWHGPVLRMKLNFTKNLEVKVSINCIAEGYQMGAAEVRILDYTKSQLFAFGWADLSSDSNRASIYLNGQSYNETYYSTNNKYNYSVFLKKTIKFIISDSNISLFINDNLKYKDNIISTKVSFIELALLKYSTICPLNIISFDNISIRYITEENVGLSSPPTSLHINNFDNFIILNWSAPDFNGNLPIIGYNIYKGITPDNLTYLTTIGNDHSYEDVMINSDDTYFYSISALNYLGESNRSDIKNLKCKNIFKFPINLVAISDKDKVILRWNELDYSDNISIIYYDIYRGINLDNLSLIASVNNTSTFIDFNILENQTYYYKIILKDEEKLNKNSILTIAKTRITKSVPSEPLNLSITPSEDNILLTWNPPILYGNTNYIQYNIYRRDSYSDEELIKIIKNKHIFSDINITKNQCYTYKICAVNNYGEGVSSKKVEGKTIIKKLPTSPQELKSISSNREIKLFWKPPRFDGNSSIINYKIYRGILESNLTYLTTIGNSLVFTDIGLTNDQTYYYKVSAINNVGEGNKSIQVIDKPTIGKTKIDDKSKNIFNNGLFIDNKILISINLLIVFLFLIFLIFFLRDRGNNSNDT